MGNGEAQGVLFEHHESEKDTADCPRDEGVRDERGRGGFLAARDIQDSTSCGSVLERPSLFGSPEQAATEDVTHSRLRDHRALRAAVRPEAFVAAARTAVHSFNVLLLDATPEKLILSDAAEIGCSTKEETLLNPG